MILDDYKNYVCVITTCASSKTVSDKSVVCYHL